jgi:release factor glutamine methyltransferase
MTTKQQVWTILDLIRSTTEYFQKNKVDPARLTAELLLAHSLKLRRLDLYLRYDQPCTEAEKSIFRDYVRRRAKGEPVQYITGSVEFWKLSLHVDPRVLIPRPDTEVLVEEAVALGKGHSAETLRILDIGTGSGAIALALKTELPSAEVTAVDLEESALEVARKNAERLGLSLRFLQSDLGQSVSGERFGLIVSNPPYISSEEIETLEPEVRAHEPRRALDGGYDGLVIIRRMFAELLGMLREDGALLLEISPEQSEAVVQLARDSGMQAHVRKDYEGRDRVVIATWPNQGANGAVN